MSRLVQIILLVWLKNMELVHSNKSANGDMNPAALALGGLSKGVSPYEMAEAYATFPNGGVRVENRVFTKVVDRDGRTILTTERRSIRF